MKMGRVIRRYKEHIFSIFFLALGFLVILYTTFELNYIISLDGDNVPQTFALYSFSAKALLNKELPLWNPYLWGGISNIGSTITEAMYPINWFLGLFSYDASSEIVSYKMIISNIIIHLFIYYCGLFFLQKRMGIESMCIRSAIALLSIYSFSFCIYFYNATWYSYLDVVCWFPVIIHLSVLIIEEVETKKSMVWICLLGVLFANEVTIGIGPTMILMAIFTVLLFVYDGFKKKRLKSNIIRISLSGGLGILLSLPLLLIVMTFTKRCARYVDGLNQFISGNDKLPYDTFIAHSAGLDDLKAMFNFLPSVSWMSISAFLLLMAIIGCFVKENGNVSFKNWALGGFIYSVLYCISLFVVDFVYYIPFLNSMREPFMYGIFVNIFATLLVVNLISSLIRKKNNNIYTISDLHDFFTNNFNDYKIMLIILLFIICYNYLPKNISFSKILFLLLFLGCIILYFGGKKNICKFLIMMIVVLNMYSIMPLINSGNISGIESISRVDQINKYNKEAINNTICQQGGKFISYGNSVLPANTGSIIDLKDMVGYFNPTTEIGVNINLHMDFIKKSELLDIKYVLLNQNNEKDLLEWFENAYGSKTELVETVKLYTSYDSLVPENVDIFISDMAGNKGWVVYEVEYYNGNSSYNEIMEWINNNDNDLKKIANVNIDIESGKNLANTFVSCGVGEYNINFIDESYNKKQYSIYSSKPGILVLTEIYDPGWRAYINGRAVDVLNVDYSNIGISIPAGDIELELRYEPREIIMGYIVQLLFILFFAICIFVYVYKLKIKGKK